MTAATTRRKSAEERREEILAIAIEHFAAGGLRGTSTELIAREAGISQPYLFRLFRTKKELFLAADERAREKVLETFPRAAAGAAGQEAGGDGPRLHRRAAARAPRGPDDDAGFRRRRRGPGDPRDRTYGRGSASR